MGDTTPTMKTPRVDPNFSDSRHHTDKLKCQQIGAVTIDELETIVEHETLVLQIVADNPNPVALLNTPCKLLCKHV